MTDPIHQIDAKVVAQMKVAEESFILSLEAPSIARTLQPGQFIQIRCTRKDDPLLPRPFSIYRVRGKKILDILYEVVGRGTELLSEAKKGGRFSIFGPLGNTFSFPKGRAVSFLVGGGAGLAPFFDLSEALVDPRRGKQKKEDVTVLLGARRRGKIFCEKDFKKLGIRFEIATDDGSYGFKGFVTELLTKHLNRKPYTVNPVRDLSLNGVNRTRIYACGPKPMLRSVAAISEKFKIPCEVSIDAYMPCGYGICFGCAVRVKQQATSDKQQENGALYKLACTDGPVFRSEELSWE